MFEIMMVLYMTANGAFYLYARKTLDDQAYKEDVPYILGHKLMKAVPERFVGKLLSDVETVKLSKLYSAKNLQGERHKYLAKKLGTVWLMLVIGGMFALIIGNDYTPERPLAADIQRPAYGDRAKSYALTYEIKEGDTTVKGTMPLTVAPSLPEGEEALAVIESKFSPLHAGMLAPGDYVNEVTQDLVLKARPFDDVPIEVTYVSLTPEVLTDKGELRRNNMTLREPYEGLMSATFSLNGVKTSYTYSYTLYRVPIALKAEKERIGDRILVEPAAVILPENLLEREGTVDWATSEEGVRGIRIFAAVVLIGALMYAFYQRTLDEALVKRKEAMLMDFPDVVTKLTLMINAGMTFSRAWHKVVTDYQERSPRQRPLYEEMLVATTQMRNGMPEREALEAFGRRCGSKEVIRMSAILIQNLRRGSHSLTEALEQLSKEAWEIRTTTAKIQGEKASTKLLIPMGISFIAVILIVMAPTMMSMNV